MAAIIIPIAMHYADKENSKSPEEKAQDAKEKVEEAAKWTEPSAWIGHLLDMFQYLYIIGAPGVFVSTSLIHCMDQADEIGRAHLAI